MTGYENDRSHRTIKKKNQRLPHYTYSLAFSGSVSVAVVVIGISNSVFNEGIQSYTKSTVFFQILAHVL